MAGKQVVRTAEAPVALGPYSQAVVVGDLVYTSGQIAIDPSTGELASGGIEEQTGRVMDNLRAVLEAAGSRLDLVIKTTCFLADIEDFAAFNEAYARYFPSDPPARTTIGVASLPRGARVEVEAVGLVA